MIQFSRGGRECAGPLGRCRPAEGAMNALLVVIAAEHFELPREIEGVPEKHLIEDLAPDRANQPFDERMRDRDVGHRFYFLDVEHPQVGKPAVKAKQGIVVGTEVFRQRLSGHGVVENATNARSEEHTSELQSPDHLVCRLLLEKKKRLTTENNERDRSTKTTP